jgi:hypothetical protein
MIILFMKFDLELKVKNYFKDIIYFFLIFTNLKRIYFLQEFFFLMFTNLFQFNFLRNLEISLNLFILLFHNNI